MGRKSGGTQKVDQTSEVVQHNIPEEFRPYLRKQMQLADALLQEDYIPYGGQRLAGFNPQEQAAFTGVQAIAQRNLPGVTGAKTYFGNLAGQTGSPVAGTDYLGVGSNYAPGTITSAYSPTAGSFGSGYGGADFSSGYGARDFTSSYQPGQITSSFQGANIGSDYQPGEIQSTYAPGQFEAERSITNIDDYMNPYTERVLDRQLARRQKGFQERRAQQQAQDTAAGGASAFGGRGLLQQQTAQTAFDEGTADIEASALDQAYQQALSASSRDIDRDLRVQQLRDQAERTRAQMAFGADTARDAAERARAQMATRAQEATARFGQAAGAQDIQAQIASDAAARAAGQMDLSAQQYADQSAQQAAKLGLTAQQYQDLSRRAAGEQTLRSQQMEDAAMRASGEQGLRAAIASDQAARARGDQDIRTSMANQRAYAAALARRDAASKYGVDLDKTEQAMDLQRMGALAQSGQDMRALTQRGLDMAYQDFIRQRDYPKEMLAYYSNLMKQNINPIPADARQTVTSPAPSRLGQMANLGLGALALGRGRQG
jgi:hypothetical protein